MECHYQMKKEINNRSLIKTKQIKRRRNNIMKDNQKRRKAVLRNMRAINSYGVLKNSNKKINLEGKMVLMKL